MVACPRSPRSVVSALMARPPISPAQRARRAAVLVLCEGSKTEPNYLGSVIRELGLTAVTVPRDHDTDPLNLVHRAIRSLKVDAGLARAYVLIDRDDHANFNAAVGLAEQHPMYELRLFLIRSYPCFELWLLLHHERCRAPMSRDEALSRLKVHVPAYEKSDLACMDELISRMDTALDNADFALVDAASTGELNPSTEMQKLIRYLREISE